MNTKRHTPFHEKYYQEEFEDTKGVIRIRKTWTDTMAKKRTKGQTTIYKTLHIKLKIE
jgi:hypothetical protein